VIRAVEPQATLQPKNKLQAFSTTPHLSFAFRYLASHFGLGLIRHEEQDDVMTFIERKQADLGKAIHRLIGSAGKKLL
jgi:hypothetical protein